MKKKMMNWRRKDKNPQSSSLSLLPSELQQQFQPTHMPTVMASPRHLIPFIAVYFLFFLSSPSSAQTQNLEATFPSTAIPAFAPGSDPTPPPFPSLPPAPSPPQQSSSFPPPSPPTNPGGGGAGGSSSSVTKAVVGTAFGSFAISGILFFILYRFTDKRRRQVPDPVVVSPHGKKSDHVTSSPYWYSTAADAGRDTGGGGGRGGGGKGGLIVDENGLDVLYLRRLEEGGRGGGVAHFCSYCKVELDLDDREDVIIAKRGRRKGGRRVEEISLIRTGSVRSSDAVSCVSSPSDSRSSRVPAKSEPPLPLPPAMAYLSTQSPPHSQPPLPPPSPAQKAPGTPARLATHNVSASAPTPPPPPPAPFKAPSAPPPPPAKVGSPPPPPPPPQKVASTPPPPPPPKAPTAPPPKASSAPPPPPPPAGGKKGPPAPPPPRAPGKGPSPLAPPPPGRAGNSSHKPPPVPDGGSGTRRAPLPPPAKLKPLHWDKMTMANVEHSMVWDQIHDGSFRFDDELMIALFGTAAAGARQSTGADKKSSNAESSAPTQIVLLDLRKSQNIAIVLRSLAIGRQEVINSLLDGHGLNSDTLEKLSKITPTKDDEQLVLRYAGDPSKLADAESFLFHLLKSVPAPFARLNHMLFRSSFDNEVLHLKESLQSLDAACKELRSRGLFVKLLEAVLKAGNRMNAGTARGNAQAFNLSSLRKLSDVKSTDGKTTLLHFVVEEVVRSEGKRCVINRNHSLGRTRSKRSGGVDAGSNNSKSPSSPSTSSSTAEKEEKEREYMKLGLPVVGGLSIEFANVKRAAMIDFDAMISTYTTLENRAKSLRHFLSSSSSGGGGKDAGEFAKEMTLFLDTAEQHLKVVGDDKDTVLEMVVRTTEYYLVGSSKDKSAPPLQLFVIVKDFLGMVDQAIVDISRNLQQQKQQMKKRAQQANAAAGLAADQSPPSSGRMSPARFPNLPRHFLSDHSRNSSGSGSDSDDDF